MGESAYVRLPEVPLGINMSWNSVPRITTIAGPSRAKRFVMFGEPADAATCLTWGMADEVTADGEARTDVVALITQRRRIPLDPANPDGPSLSFRGGCTLVMDREYGTDPIRYAIVRPVWSQEGERRRDRLAAQAGHGPNALYGVPANGAAAEPFAALHRGLRPSDSDLPPGVG